MFFDAENRIASAHLSDDDHHDYQQEAIAFAMRVKKCALWMALGLGKSGVSGKVLSETLANMEINRWLVIAPLRVSRVTWPETFSEWKYLAGIEYTVLSDEPESRAETKTAAVIRRSKNSRTSVDFINMEMLHVLVDYWRMDWPYDGVIIDEASKFKDHSSTRFKKLALVFPYITRMIELTATPASEGYMSLFSQIALLDGGERLGKVITHYREDYFSYDPYKRKYKINEGNKKLIDDKIADIVLVQTAEEYLPDQQEPNFIEHKLPVSPKFEAQYAQMERESVLELGDVDIVADNAAAVWGKLLQMASGMVYETWKEPHPTREGKMVLKRKPHHLHDEKLDELEMLLDQLEGKPLLLAYHWEESLDRLLKRFPKAVLIDKDGKFKKNWDAGKTPLLIGHPQSVGHGLNLQKPTNEMAFFDLHPSLENFLQMVGRLARQGQKYRVNVHLFLAKGTYDFRVWESLQDKKEGEEALLRRIRYIQKKERDKKAAVVDSAARSMMAHTEEDDML